MNNLAKQLKISSIVTFAAGVVSFGFLIYTFYALNTLRGIINRHEPFGETVDILGLFLVIGLSVSFLFHISSFFAQTLRFQYTRTMTLFEVGVLLNGIVSFVCLIGDFAALSDIGKQYTQGIGTTSEMQYLYIALVPHGIFHIFQFFLLLTNFHLLKQEAPQEPALKDEVVFIVAQYIGVACGLIGLGFTTLMYTMGISARILGYILPYYCPLIILPYILMCLYWILLKRNEPIAEIYDEKQWRDVERAGLTALLGVLPVLAALYVSAYFYRGANLGMLWFPFYLFATVLLFSGSVLFFDRRPQWEE